MSIETDPVPPVPSHTPPVNKKDNLERFENNWTQWFVQLRNKINIINTLIVNLSNLTGNGIVVIQNSLNWFTRSLVQGSGITITNADGTAGDPTIAHADTSSVANLTSDNSNGVVIQDVTFTFDTFGHVTGATVGTVNLDGRYSLDSAVVHIAGAETITGQKTLTAQTLFRNGSTSGGAMFGAEVNSSGIADNTRKIFRATLPSYTPSSINPMFIFGADTQNTTATDIVYFGGWQGATGMTAACRIIFATTATPGSGSGTNHWEIDSTGFITPLANNTYDIGSSARSIKAIHANSYMRSGVQVVGARNTGWSAMTGTGSKATIAAAAAGTASAAYVQSELQSALNRIAALEARLKALDDALFTHGLIGA